MRYIFTESEDRQKVIDTRATIATDYPLDIAIIFNYPCCVGLPYSYAYYIGQEVHFLTNEGLLLGPWLVVDVEAERHAGMMKNRRLAVDIYCPKYPS